MNKSRKVYKKRVMAKKNKTKRCVYTDEGKKYLKIIRVTKQLMKQNMKGMKGLAPPNGMPMPPNGMPMPPKGMPMPPKGMPMPPKGMPMPPNGMPMPPPNGMPMPPPNGMPMPPPNGMPMPPNDLAESKRRKNVKSQKKLKPEIKAV
jgi:hypothetical protein